MRLLLAWAAEPLEALYHKGPYQSKAGGSKVVYCCSTSLNGCCRSKLAALHMRRKVHAHHQTDDDAWGLWGHSKYYRRPRASSNICILMYLDKKVFMYLHTLLFLYSSRILIIEFLLRLLLLYSITWTWLSKLTSEMSNNAIYWTPGQIYNVNYTWNRLKTNLCKIIFFESF